VRRRLVERKFPQRWGRRLDVTSDGHEIGKFEVVIVDPKEKAEEEEKPSPGRAP